MRRIELKNIFKLLVIISISSFVSCSLDFGKSFEIINNLRTEFDFNTVEISIGVVSLELVLQDIDHDDMSLKSLQSYVTKVDNYLIDKYPELDKIKTREYLSSGGGGFEIVEFTLDASGNITNTEKYIR